MISDWWPVAASAGRQCKKERVSVTRARFYLQSDTRGGASLVSRKEKQRGWLLTLTHVGRWTHDHCGLESRQKIHVWTANTRWHISEIMKRVLVVMQRPGWRLKHFWGCIDVQRHSFIAYKHTFVKMWERLCVRVYICIYYVYMHIYIL